MIPLSAVQAICNSKRPEIEKVFPALVASMERWYCTTPLRQAMYIAQTAHETMGYKYLREIASGEAYEGRKDLGNTEPGDGKRFPGRGLMMLTGRGLYTRCSEELYWPRDLLVTKPELVEQPDYAANTAGWFYDFKQLNKLADASDIVGASRRINGGNNGLAERVELYKRACYALGIG